MLVRLKSTFNCKSRILGVAVPFRHLPRQMGDVVEPNADDVGCVDDLQPARHQVRIPLDAFSVEV